jgi:NTP pyrophosphatase (non-canonical NTP hydrolase)
MTDPAAMLAEFHAAFGLAYGHGSIADSRLRRSLHIEETRELIQALEAGDLRGAAKELADVVYVAYGTAHSLGIPLNLVLEAVHASNMTKFVDGKAVFRPDGKVLKGPNYRPPDLTGLLDEGAA